MLSRDVVPRVANLPHGGQVSEGSDREVAHLGEELIGKIKLRVPPMLLHTYIYKQAGSQAAGVQTHTGSTQKNPMKTCNHGPECVYLPVCLPAFAPTKIRVPVMLLHTNTYKQTGSQAAGV